MTLRRLARGAASLLVPILLAAGTASAQTAQTGNVFNPNISVIGNALGIAGHGQEGDVTLFDADVTLLAPERHEAVRARAGIDDGLQADLGLPELKARLVVDSVVPGDFLVRVGRLKGAFGKINTEHTHVRAFAD